MKTIGNNVYISLEKESEDEVQFKDGTTIKINTTYDVYGYARQFGIARHMNSSVTEKYGIRPGDKVYFHHFIPKSKTMQDYDVSNGEMIDGENLYRAHIDDSYVTIYAYVRDGEVFPINHWVFVEPIMKDIPKSSSGIYLGTAPEEEKNMGRLVHINDDAREIGMSVGDKVMFTKDSEYPITVEGKKLYRMRNDDIMAIFP